MPELSEPKPARRQFLPPAWGTVDTARTRSAGIGGAGVSQRGAAGQHYPTGGRFTGSTVAKGCGLGCIGLIASLIVLVVAVTVCSNSDADFELDDGGDGKALTDSQYGRVVDELTKMALARDWCHKRSGGLDSRDIAILTFYAEDAEDMAEKLYGSGPYSIDEADLSRHLVRKNWSAFMGQDFDRGGRELRYRPPGCG